MNISIEFLDCLGSDLTVVNAARVSFAMESEEFGSRDKKLVRYLAAHGHWTPFAHVQVQLRIKAPVFVARQLVKHQVGLVWNEVSRRYVDFTPEFHAPEAWRKRAPDKKQGSLLETFTGIDEEHWDTIYWGHMETCKTIYDIMIASGVAPEQARMVLPQSMMTEWYWTGSLVAFARVVSQRLSEDAQYECRVVAEKIDQLLVNHEPISYSWSCLTKRV
jgi:thymidylate synthase (FAD)